MVGMPANPSLRAATDPAKPEPMTSACPGWVLRLSEPSLQPIGKTELAASNVDLWINFRREKLIALLLCFFVVAASYRSARQTEPEWFGHSCPWAASRIELTFFPSVSLVAAGVSARKWFLADVDVHSQALPEQYLLLYISSLVLYFLSLAIIDLGLQFGRGTGYRRARLSGNLVAAALVAIIGLAAADIPGANLVRTVSAIMLALLAFRIYLDRRYPIK
jgi:hypothetical protein